MKKAVIVPDSFKGTMSSVEICEKTVEALQKKYKGIECISLPIADGGEGTVDAFLYAVGGKKVTLTVNNPIGEKIKSYYAIINGDTAVIETASASGLTLLNKLAPMAADTFGTGEQIKDALEKGIRKFIIGLGGSATTDAGTGLLRALSIKFLNENGEEVQSGGIGLKDIFRIDTSLFDTRIAESEITVLCDVENTLYGKNGAAFVFSPQKGASNQEVLLLDEGLVNIAKVSEKLLGKSTADIKGTGAAGGLGFALITFCGAKLKGGIDTVLDICKFDEKCKDADLIITGEGKMDSQSLNGKVPFGVASRAGNIPVTAIVGLKKIDDSLAKKHGISRIIETDKEKVGDCRTEREKYIAQFMKAIEKI